MFGKTPRLALAATTAVLIVAAPGAAPETVSDLPDRIPGLWEIRGPAPGGQIVTVMQQCWNAEAQQAWEAYIQSSRKGTCRRTRIEKTTTGYVVENECVSARGKTRTRATYVGDLERDFVQTEFVLEAPPVSSKIASPPDDPGLSLTAKWLGPCRAGQRVGDILVPGVEPSNVFDLLKKRQGTPAPSDPAAPKQ